jgi:hypothetical protein
MAAYIASLPGTMVVKKWFIGLAKLAKKSRSKRLFSWAKNN